MGSHTTLLVNGRVHSPAMPEATAMAVTDSPATSPTAVWNMTAAVLSSRPASSMSCTSSCRGLDTAESYPGLLVRSNELTNYLGVDMLEAIIVGGGIGIEQYLE